MSTVVFPGRKVDEFLSDFVLEFPRKGTVAHGVPPRVQDGRVYVHDERPDSPWTSFVAPAYRVAYARPSDELKELVAKKHGPGGIEAIHLIRWYESDKYPKGAILMTVRPGGENRIPTYYICLEVPEYAGFLHGEKVSAKWWDHEFHDAMIVGFNIGDREDTYRVYFPHADTDGARHGIYIDVKPENIRKRE